MIPWNFIRASSCTTLATGKCLLCLVQHKLGRLALIYVWTLVCLCVCVWVVNVGKQYLLLEWKIIRQTHKFQEEFTPCEQWIRYLNTRLFDEERSGHDHPVQSREFPRYVSYHFNRFEISLVCELCVLLCVSQTSRTSRREYDALRDVPDNGMTSYAHTHCKHTYQR